MLKSQAVILSKMPYRESSAIVRLLTYEGRISALIHGVSGKKGKAAILTQGNIIEVVFSPTGQPGGLHHLSEYSLVHQHEYINRSPLRSAMAVFALELTGLCVEDSQQDAALYDFLKKFLSHLDSCENPQFLCLYFALELTHYLGFYPSIREGGTGDYFDLESGLFCLAVPLHNYYIAGSNLLNFLALGAFDTATLYELPRKGWENLWKILMTYYKLHLSDFKEPRSLDFLKEITAMEFFEVD